MDAHRTKTFKSGNSVALRLPKELGIGPGVEVEIEQAIDGLTVRRKRMTNQELVEAIRSLPKPDRPMKRDRIIFPKRPGL